LANHCLAEAEEVARLAAKKGKGKIIGILPVALVEPKWDFASVVLITIPPGMKERQVARRSP